MFRCSGAQRRARPSTRTLQRPRDSTGPEGATATHNGGPQASADEGPAAEQACSAAAGNARRVTPGRAGEGPRWRAPCARGGPDPAGSAATGGRRRRRSLGRPSLGKCSLIGICPVPGLLSVTIEAPHSPEPGLRGGRGDLDGRQGGGWAPPAGTEDASAAGVCGRRPASILSRAIRSLASESARSSARLASSI